MVDIYFFNRGDNPNGDFHVIGIEREGSGGLFQSSFYLQSSVDILFYYIVIANGLYGLWSQTDRQRHCSGGTG